MSKLKPFDERGFVSLPRRSESLEGEGSRPRGLCFCGCGQPAPIATKTERCIGNVKGQPKRYLKGHFKRKSTKMVPRPCGYVHVNIRVNGVKTIAQEHVLIAAAALGKPLPKGAQVHHVDRNGRNNAHSNLVVCQDIKYHALLHRRQRALDACGDPSANRCVHCRGYNDQPGLVVHGKSRHGTPLMSHPACRKAYLAPFYKRYEAKRPPRLARRGVLAA